MGLRLKLVRSQASKQTVGERFRRCVVLEQKDEGSATRVFSYHHSFIHSIHLFELMYDRYMEEWNEANKGRGGGYQILCTHRCP